MKFVVKATIESVEEGKPRLSFNIKTEAIGIGDVKMLILPVDQKCTASITPIDSKGNPARVDGVPAWGTSAETILGLVPAADGMSAEVVPLGPTGSAQINVSADADLGSGVTNIAGVLDVSVVAGQAVGFTIETTEPIPQGMATKRK